MQAKESLDLVVSALNNNEIVCFPTETVMGLAVVVDNQQTYDKLVNAKNRPSNKAFPVAMLKKDIYKYCDVNALQRKVIEEFLPGPLTLILKKKANVSSFIGKEDGTVAIRCSEDEFVQEVLKRVGKPLFLTSANLAGEKVAMSKDEAVSIFKDKVKVYVDGEIQGDLASTIIDLTKENVAILRQGKILLEDILNVIKEK